MSRECLRFGVDWTYLLTRLPRAAGMDWKSPCLFRALERLSQG